MTDASREETFRQIKNRRWYREAMRAVTHMRKRYERGLHAPVPSKALMEICGVRLHKHWSGVLILIKDILWEMNLDLANYPGAGYFISYKPEMTLREIIKSILRSFSHMGSARKRREKYAEDFLKLPEETKNALGMVDLIIESVQGISRPMEKVLKQCIVKLDDLYDAADDVANPVVRLLDGPSQVATVQQMFDNIKEVFGEEDPAPGQGALFEDE